ncbi:hypothetical protein [Acetobacter fabarum]|uniref:hypothetical protein n=1 Tax=Acetobacter fabarum TaxID=483199 RepID=UPI00209E9D3F|nr:hypothetical protein [Acetobacter fabarum]MCP1227935.1 hypothetical protein [Acetobacter fabarum]MCP1233432.1 hypothetical protein [Acetobacter fabarum]
MTQKPTGVFVPFPLTEAQVSACSDARAKAWVEQGKPTTTSTFEAALLAIGTPVTGGELAVVGWGLYSVGGGKPSLFTNEAMAERWAKHFGRTLHPVVRQSEAQAQIAARDAEIVRLREALVVARGAITSGLNAKSIVCTVWAGPAETLVDYIDAALKGGAA